MAEINPRLLKIQNSLGDKFEDSPSPFMRWLSPRVRSAEYGALCFEYLIREEMTNPMGTLHGGVTAGIMDDIIGATLYSMNLGHHYTTINLQVDYFAAAKAGDFIEAKSSIVKRGAQIINLQCELWLPSKDRLLAKAYSNMIRLEHRLP